MQDKHQILTKYLTWKIKIQLLAMQIGMAHHEGVAIWKTQLIQTITEIHSLAVSYGPFDYHQPPPGILPLYRVPRANEDTLFEQVSRELTTLFGSVVNAGTLRTEP